MRAYDNATVDMIRHGIDDWLQVAEDILRGRPDDLQSKKNSLRHIAKIRNQAKGLSLRMKEIIYLEGEGRK